MSLSSIPIVYQLQVPLTTSSSPSQSSTFQKRAVVQNEITGSSIQGKLSSVGDNQLNYFDESPSKIEIELSESQV